MLQQQKMLDMANFLDVLYRSDWFFKFADAFVCLFFSLSQNIVVSGI